MRNGDLDGQTQNDLVRNSKSQTSDGNFALICLLLTEDPPFFRDRVEQDFQLLHPPQLPQNAESCRDLRVRGDQGLAPLPSGDEDGRDQKVPLQQGSGGRLKVKGHAETQQTVGEEEENSLLRLRLTLPFLVLV